MLTGTSPASPSSSICGSSMFSGREIAEKVACSAHAGSWLAFHDKRIGVRTPNGFHQNSDTPRGQAMVSRKALSSTASISWCTPQLYNDLHTSGRSEGQLVGGPIAVTRWGDEMETLPSARCSFICVLAFIKTRMIRKSGYLASVDAVLMRLPLSDWDRRATRERRLTMLDRRHRVRVEEVPLCSSFRLSELSQRI